MSELEGIRTKRNQIYSPKPFTSNIQADELAGQYRLTPSEATHPKWLLPTKRCRLVVDDKPIQLLWYTSEI